MEKVCYRGHLNFESAERCAECGMRNFFPTQEDVQGKEAFSHTVYLGGLPNFKNQSSGDLQIDDVGLHMNGQAVVLWAECNGVTVEAAQVAKSKLKASLAFGVLGAVTAKNTKNQALVTVRRNDGALAFFIIDSKSAHEVKAQLAPTLHSVGVALYNEFPLSRDFSSTQQVPAKVDLVERIRELGRLRDETLLTDDEFQQLKAELLRGD